MKYIFFLIALSAVTAVLSKKERVCHACFDGVCYTKTQIYKRHQISGQLAVDRKHNIIYFHYEDHAKISNRTVAFDLDDKRSYIIPDIEFSFARTVDQATREVYIGAQNGIYKYNPITNETILFNENNKTVWHMQYKNKLYYTILSMKGLQIYEEGETKSVSALNDYSIDDFIVDKRHDIYFTSNYTLYKLKNGTDKPSVFSVVIYSLTTDVNGNAYFIQRESRGLSKINYRNGEMVEMGAFGNGAPFKTVFDKFNNIIFYDDDTSKLYYLKPNYSMCLVRSEGTGKTLKKMVSAI